MPASGPAPITGADGLDERARAILAFERDWAVRAGEARSRDKDAEIRSRFGLGSARYYQVLFALIDSPAALRHDPLLVRRLQRLRDTRTVARARRTLGPADDRRTEDDAR
ncbi:MAG: DUF3263 domain-containing protein [Actinomycetales bacterium]|nr:DUF3263 domain-containing protein [Actinomycetales bacterium]